jgi:molybdate transport system ATP-binding protein
MEPVIARFHINWPGFTLDFDLTIPGRGVTSIFGPSGSGKTTLLRCIAGLERVPDGFLSFKGEVWQDGQHFLPVHKRPLGYVFQEANLFPHLSVLKNLRYGLERSSAQDEESLDHAVALLGIGHLLQRMPERLSGGERQRVAMARALALRPRILLMDEPLAALDLARKQEILPYLERLRDQLEIPLLYVTHSPEETARLADHLVLMDNGRLTASGPLAETLARLDLPVRLGEERSVVLDGVVEELDGEWNLARVAFDGGSLWMRDRGIAIGSRVRMRVPSGGVSLALEPQRQSSVLNCLAGVVGGIGADEHPGLTLVRVRIGAAVLLARVTRRSAAALGLEAGKPVWAQIKSVAVVE